MWSLYFNYKNYKGILFLATCNVVIIIYIIILLYIQLQFVVDVPYYFSHHVCLTQ
jgi:hypothetical protein